MTGFIENGNGVAGKGSEIMQEFNPTSLPTINTLGNDFAVIDQWFSSVPGPTQVFFFYTLHKEIFLLIFGLSSFFVHVSN